MPRTLLRLLPIVLCGALVAGCGGGKEVDLPSDATAQEQRGARIFYQRCQACHTLEVVKSEGSAVNVNQREYKDGPNFNVRAEEYEQVLYAIRNGGFSSGPMPQNIVVGDEAEDVARFVAKYSGRDAARSPSASQPSGLDGEQGTSESP